MLFGIGNAKFFFMDLKTQVHESRVKDFRELLNMNIPPLIEKHISSKSLEVKRFRIMAQVEQKRDKVCIYD